MKMFYNYQDLASNHGPNNLTCAFPGAVKPTKLNPLDTSKPYEEYNTQGDLIGYFWRYGDTVNLDFSIDGEITLEKDAIILSTTAEVPTISTVGKINQRAYNIVDLKSWTCVGIEQDKYIWTQDVDFTYPQDGMKDLYIPVDSYIKDKQIEVVIYNFRMEPIVSRIYTGTTNVIFEIDTELSKKLLKGIYYCSVTVYDDKSKQTIFDTTDCKLLVK